MTAPARPDRRTDDTTRDRVAQIQGRWEHALRAMWIAIVGLYLCAVVGGYLLWHQSHAIQKNRVENIRIGCQATNAQNQAIRAILTASRATIRERQARGQITEKQADGQQRLIDDYVARFPIIGDCATFARQTAATG